MFLTCLETDLNDINKVKKAAVLVTVGGVIALFFLSYACAQIYDSSTAKSILSGYYCLQFLSVPQFIL